MSAAGCGFVCAAGSSSVGSNFIHQRSRANSRTACRARRDIVFSYIPSSLCISLTRKGFRLNNTVASWWRSTGQATDFCSAKQSGNMVSDLHDELSFPCALTINTAILLADSATHVIDIIDAACIRNTELGLTLFRTCRPLSLLHYAYVAGRGGFSGRVNPRWQSQWPSRQQHC